MEEEHIVKHRTAQRALGWLALPMLLALSSCALPTPGGAAPAPTQTPVYAPAGWTAYRGDHFTIAYPTGWTEHQTTSNGGQSSVITLAGPQPRDQITISETRFTPDQRADFCSTTGQTATQLAGLPVLYQVVEGVHRQWTFVSAGGISYGLSAFDADQPTTMQEGHNAILATFRPDDRASDCS